MPSNSQQWPVQPIEYGTRDWLRREVGMYLQLGGDFKALDYAQQGRIDSIIDSGYMRFITPPSLPQRTTTETQNGQEVVKDEVRRSPHSWSFLNQAGPLELTNGTYLYDLPSDFSGVSGDMIITTGDNRRLPVVGEEQLRTLVLGGDTGSPKYVALRPKRTDGTARQKWELLVYPIPSESILLDYRYKVTPPTLTDDQPYPLGGTVHAETVLASCLAIAEERNGGAADGVMYQRFIERLAASIHHDKLAGKPTDDTGIWKESTGENSIKSLVGLAMGFGQNDDAWTDAQRQKVKECVRQGLRRFYVPPPIPGELSGHVWSFLTPINRLTTVTDQYAYDLPSSFAMLDGPITFATSENAMSPPIEIVGEHHIRERLQRQHPETGKPYQAAVRVKEGMETVGTRYELLLYPIPDEAYDLEYRYKISADTESELVYGGPDHYQTALEACLAAADLMAGVKNSPHEKAFIERLVASVSHDRRMVPPNMGYNGDYRDRDESLKDGRWYRYGDNLVTYNGQTY